MRERDWRVGGWQKEHETSCGDGPRRSSHICKNPGDKVKGLLWALLIIHVWQTSMRELRVER